MPSHLTNPLLFIPDPEIMPDPEKSEEVPSGTLLDAVIELCDETSGQGVPKAPMVLPTFAEQGFEEHDIDLAPHDEDRYRREKVLREAGDWTELAHLLLERAEFTSSVHDAATLLVEVAGLYGEQLQNPPAAITILAKAIEVDPAHLQAADELETLAGAFGEWGELIGSFTEAADKLSQTDPSASGELRIRAACAYVVGHRDIVRAFDSIAHVRAAIPRRVQAHLAVLENEVKTQRQLESMIAVCHRVGDQERSARLLSRAIAMSQSVVERAYYHHSIALIEVNRDESEAAEWHFREALKLDPAHHDARDALAALYREQGDFKKVVDLLEEARMFTSDVSLRASYSLQAAQICSDTLGENTRAINLFEAARQIQPNSLEASLPVVDRYFQQERWGELESVLDACLLGIDSQGLDTNTLADLYLKAGTCSLQLENYDKARRQFAECTKRMPHKLGAAVGSARALLALNLDSRAIVEIKRAMDIHKLLGHSSGDMVSTMMLSAEAHLKIGKQDRALDYYRLCVNEGSPEAMGLMANLHSLRGEHHKAVKLNLTRASSLEKKERLATLCGVADTLYHEIGDTEAAIDICYQALSVDKECRDALHRLAMLHSRSEQWRDAIKTIVRMASLETGAIRRGRYLQAAGTIARKQGQNKEAVALLNKAIDSYAVDTVMSVETETRDSSFHCFKLATDALREQEDWRGLEVNYRKMICRLEPGDPEVGALWQSLGEVYRDKLGETKAAIDSYEVACTLDARSLTNHRVLVDLYDGAGPDKLDKAIDRRRTLLEAEPHKPEHYKALRGLFVRTRQMDRAWCVCRALDHLGIADDRELGFYRRNLPSSLIWPSRPLNAEMWTRLRDKEVDPDISRIFGLVSEVIALNDAVSPARAGVTDAHHPQFDQLKELFSGVSYVFGLSGFDCFVQPRYENPVTLASVRRGAKLEPTFVLGRGLYEGKHLEHIVGSLGRFLFYGRRSYYLRLALREPGQLEAAFQAALTFVRPETLLPPVVGPYRNRFRDALRANLHPTWVTKLTETVDRYIHNSGSTFDAAKWCAGVDATARHASLLLTADLNVSMKALKAEPNMSGTRLDHARKRLVLDSVSESHMSLREDLGLAFVKG